MHEIIAKIARFAVSKFAAFCYAVAVGVAGNVIFHFVQPRDPAPSVTPVVATAPHEAPSAAGAAGNDAGAAPAAPAADGASCGAVATTGATDGAGSRGCTKWKIRLPATPTATA